MLPISLSSAAFLFSTSLPSLFHSSFLKGFFLMLFRNCPLQPKALTSSSCTPAPLRTLPGVCHVWGKKKNKNPHLDGATSDLWLFAEQENDCICKIPLPEYLPFPKYAHSCLCSVGRRALPGLCTPHFYTMQFKRGGKKIHNSPHTFLGSLFSLSRIKCCWHLSPHFPEWAWRQNYADSQTHTRFQLSAANLQLFFFFFPRVHLPIKGDWEKQLRFTVSYLVAWNFFHLEKASTSFEWGRVIIIPRHNNPALCSLGAQVNADITTYEWFPPHWQVLDHLTPHSLSCASLLSFQDKISPGFLCCHISGALPRSPEPVHVSLHGLQTLGRVNPPGFYRVQFRFHLS